MLDAQMNKRWRLCSNSDSNEGTHADLGNQGDGRGDNMSVLPRGARAAPPLPCAGPLWARHARHQHSGTSSFEAAADDSNKLRSGRRKDCKGLHRDLLQE